MFLNLFNILSSSESLKFQLSSNKSPLCNKHSLGEKAILMFAQKTSGLTCCYNVVQHYSVVECIMKAWRSNFYFAF